MQWIWGWCFMEKAVRLRKVFSATVLLRAGEGEVLERLVGSGWLAGGRCGGRNTTGGIWVHG